MQSHHLSPSALLTRALGRTALALTAATAAVVAQSQGFTYTGAIQTFTVPANVTSLYVDVRGGAGGSSIGPTTYPGGGGGVVHGHVQVTPGSEIRILVGGRGADGVNGRGGGGGGASYVAIGTSDAAFATPLLVGGGGAGASSHSGGQIGGSTMGGTGLGGSSASTGGGGGGILTGGANGSGTAQGGAAATAGGLGGLGQNTGGNGGFGGGGGGGGPQGGGGAGGGGGGGYTGGNAQVVGGAIGGTSFVANVVQNPEVIAGLQAGNGFVTLLWGQAPWLVLGTGQTQTMVVPEGVTSATITAFGARGGHGRGPANTAEGPGGLGAAARATFAVAGGQTLRMRIGEPGQDVLPTAALAGGGGGGATVVALGTSDAAFGTPLLVAGGGGGGGGTPSGPRAGGAGGVVVGGSGNGGLARQAAGGGGLSVDGNGPGFGRATANGSAGGAAIPAAGSGGYGGGGAGGNANAAFPNQGFGGGGGGYDGGDGAGTNDAASGGSSFFAAAGANVLSTPGGNTADYGRVEIVFAWPAASTSIAGTGCGTTPLTIDADAGSLPRLPSTFVSRTTNIPAMALFTAVSIGLSDSVWSGGTLPMPLGSMGAPGCRLYQDAALGAFHLTTAAGAGAATFAFAIPDAPQIAGMDLFQQAWCADPTANGLGVVTSNKLRLRLGL